MHAQTTTTTHSAKLRTALSRADRLWAEQKSMARRQSSMGRVVAAIVVVVEDRDRGDEAMCRFVVLSSGFSSNDCRLFLTFHA